MSATTSRRSYVPINVLTSAAGLAVLGGCLLAIDSRVREQVAGIAAGHGATGDLAGSATHLHHTIDFAARNLRDLCLANAPLGFLGVGAIVLVLFMLRT
jgi:hypothetical protein